MNNTFLISIVSSALIAAIATALALKKNIKIKRILITSLYLSILSIPIAGFYVGTWPTHGFDIPWWFFGIINAIFILLVTLIVIFLARIFSGVFNASVNRSMDQMEKYEALVKESASKVDEFSEKSKSANKE